MKEHILVNHNENDKKVSTKNKAKKFIHLNALNGEGKTLQMLVFAKKK